MEEMKISSIKESPKQSEHVRNTAKSEREGEKKSVLLYPHLKKWAKQIWVGAPTNVFGTYCKN